VPARGESEGPVQLEIGFFLNRWLAMEIEANVGSRRSASLVPPNYSCIIRFLVLVLFSSAKME